MPAFLLCIDQGTTSSRAVVFDDQARIVAKSQKEFAQHFPHDGWVEHDPQVIWQDTVSVCRDALFKANVAPKQVVGLGITNQRETTVVWERKTATAIYPAIVWQDRRTAEQCDVLKSAGHEITVQQKTGLLIDPYFSATKVQWILNNVPGARERAQAGELAFGTIECYLLWRLTDGRSHFTDAANASRTGLFNIHEQCWDDELLALYDVPKSLLPEVRDNQADFGYCHSDLFSHNIPIYGMAGDQQAATIGQACFTPGMMKSTFGTGAFMLLNTGDQAHVSQHRLLTTVAYRIAGKVTYALEGSVFVAGAAMQWLRDNIHFVKHASDSQALAESVPDTDGVYMVPAFTGLGAPYWNPNARGAIFGITRHTSIAHITRAALEAVAYQTRDLLTAMQADGAQCEQLRIDGGMVANDWLCQELANVLQVNVMRPQVIETTVLGVAFLAGMEARLWTQADCAVLWQAQTQFMPQCNARQADRAYIGWQQAVEKLVTQ